jgi:hypothetical protein
MEQASITTPILRVITNLINGNFGDFVIEELIKCGLLPNIRQLLNRGGFANRLECLSLLSNIAASMTQVPNLIEFVPYFLNIIGNQQHPRLCQEAAWALANLTSQLDSDQIVVVVNNWNTFSSLISFLSSNGEHPLTDLKLIQSIVNILASGDDPNAQYEYNPLPLLLNEYGI